MSPGSERGSNCANCDAPLADAASRHCARCGQRLDLGRLDVREAVGHAFDQVVGWDSRLATTFVGLLRNPGRVAREYVAGRRLKYINPLRYAFFSLALLVLLPRFLGIDLSAGATDWATSGQAGDKPWVIDFVKKSQLHLHTATFLSLPVYALVLRLLDSAKRFNFAECLALTLFTHGQVYLVVIPIILALTSAPQIALGIRVAFHVLYVTWALKVFYEIAIWRALLRHVLATLAFVTVVAVILTLMLTLFALWAMGQTH